MSEVTIEALSRQIQCLTAVIEQLQKERSAPKLTFRPTVAVIEELITAKQAGNRREIYIKSLRYYLTRWAKHYPELTSLTTADVEAWLTRFPGPSARQTWMNRLSALFSFANRRGYILGNPCDRIDRIRVDRNEPVILTVAQSRAMLAVCSPRMKPYLILGLFAGIRPEELMRLKWRDINLDTETVKVDGKTRRRRIVPLEPIAVELLKGCTLPVDYQWASIMSSDKENVAPRATIVRRWKRRVRGIIGGKWTADILRHTAASYLLAKYEDAAKVAHWLGNSPKILLTHYNSPVAKAECEKFWSMPVVSNQPPVSYGGTE